MQTKILGFKKVCSITDLSRSTVYRYMDAGTFPQSVKLGGGRRVGFLLHEIEEWMNNLHQHNMH